MSQRNATALATRAEGHRRSPGGTWIRHAHIGAAPLSGCSACCGCFYLVCLLGGSGAILERDEAGV
jgi:hypothetical protein